MSEEFWDVAGELMAADERLVEGTIMGHGCLRLGGEFVAMPELNTGRLIVKLDAARVAELIAEGVASSFAPAGKVFKEWAAVENAALWRDLLTEAIAKAAR
jgi:hypothetical protein